MGIASNETEIVGAWVMVNRRLTEDDTSHRINALIETELQHVATTRDGWEKLYRDIQDGRYWELTYPSGEMQGGGPPALFLINPEKAKEKYNVSI